MIKQCISDVDWCSGLPKGNGLDYLLIDTPPGTSDEHIAIAEELQVYGPDGAVIVTTPQGVAIDDVKKELDFCRKVLFPVLGIVENMSGFVCPFCGEVTDIFSSGGGKRLSEEQGFEYWGKVPIDPRFVEMIENQGKDQGLMREYLKTTMFPLFEVISNKVLKGIKEK